MANKDTLIKMFEGIRDERTKHANTARRIGNAFLSMLDFASSAGDGKLSSVHDDIAQGFITFVKGLMVNQLAQLKGGASFGSDGSYSFDKDGNLVIESAHSRDFDEMLQNGFVLKRNPTSGKYTLSISDLIVWGRMVINTLETRKKYAIGGNVYLSGASSKIQHVEKVYSEDGETVVGYKCYILKDDGTMATQNNWVVGDQALCQTFDIEEGVYQNVSNQYYWRLVTQVSEENVAITEKYIDKDGNEQIRELYEGQKFAWVVLSRDDCDTNSGIPASGDTIVLDGHRLTENEDTDYTERTNVLMLEATGSGSPRIIALTGVVDYKHTTDNEVFILSPRKVIFTTEHFEIRTASGAPITFVHFMGPWTKDTEYHYYDQVSHANALWTCIVEKGKSTTAEPTDGSTYWRKEMSGGKGEKGDKGEDGLSGNGIVPAYTRSEGKPTLPTSTDKNNLDNGWSLAIPSVGDVENVSYGDSSWADYNDDSGCTWKKSPTTAASSTSSCLVTFTTTQANQVVKFVIKSFGEPRYDYIFLSEIDAGSVPSRPTSNGRSRAVSGNGVELSVTDIIATAGTHTVYVCYGKDVSGDFHGDYGLFRIGSAADIPLWQSNGKEVFTRGDDGATKSEIESWSEPFKVTGEDGADGKDGTDGEDAYRVEVSPATLVFDTGDNGLVGSATLSGKYATVTVYKGNQKISANNLSLPSNYETKKSTNVEGNISNVNGEARVTISSIGTETISEDVTVSKSSGQISFPIDVFGERNTLMWATVNVQVNVAKFTGSVVVNNKQYESKFEEISTRFKDTPTNKDLTDVESRIAQTAREISLSVSEKTIGRRNLLIGSAFQRDDSNRIVNYSASIEINSGYQGTNCVKSIDNTKKGDPHYIGVFWDGSQGGKSIKITKGKKYVLSCYCKTNDINAIFCLEALYTDKQTNAQRKWAPKYLTNSSYRCKSANRWELFTAVIDTTDAEYDYIAFNFFEYSNGDYGRIEAWICRPMVEEGDTYNGWTLSTEDYDYIGGNMLDNTLSLDKSGTLYDVNGTLTPLGFGESTSIYKSFTYKLKGTVYSFSQLPSYGNAYGDTYYVSNTQTCYRYNGSEFENVGNDYYYEVLSWRKSDGEPFGLEANKDYVLSFMAKGTGKITAYFYNPVTNVFVEDSLGGTATNEDGAANFQLTSDWKKYWVHWRPSDSLHKYVLLRLNRTIQSSAGDAPITNCYIAQPKLEAGAVVTEYTERKSDLIDKASLKAAGIVVNSESVTLYGSQVHIKKNKNDINDTVLIDNNTGTISAGLIKADEVVARGIKAQDLEATSLKVTGNSQLGIFEIHTATGDDRDQYTISGDSIKYSGGYKFPDGKTEAYGEASFLTYKPMFIRQGIPDSGGYMRLGHQFTEWDDGNISGESKNYFFVGAAARYVCSGDTYSCTRNALPVTLKYDSDINPAAYIYSVLANDSAAFAIYTQAVGTAGERLAIQTNGAIRGVEALNIETIWTGKQISSGIGAVRCLNTAEITIYLPVNPVIGQKFYVLQEGSGKVNITGDSNHQIIKFNKGIVTTCNSNCKGQISIFIWSGGYWFGSFFNGIF